jgi:hypothetical protein
MAMQRYRRRNAKIAGLEKPSRDGPLAAAERGSDFPQHSVGGLAVPSKDGLQIIDTSAF